MKILLLCAAGPGFPYRVMRCASAAGAEVYVFGDNGIERLARSRYCKKLILTIHGFNGTYDRGLAAEIDWHVQKLGVDLVVPGGDPPSTRALGVLKPMLQAPCFPVPTPAQFDRLNNKWEFAKLCAELGIASPATQWFPDVAALSTELAGGGVPLPAMVKPVNLSGSGVVQLDAGNMALKIAEVRSSPLILQEFIEGQDLGASIFCRNGEILVFVGFRRDSDVLRTYEDEQIRGQIGKIVKHLVLDGVLNFDMRRTPDGHIYYLECNPRLFYNMSWLMLAGINFVGLGINGGDGASAPVPGGTEIKLPRGIARALLKPWTLTRRDFATIEYLLADPIAILADQLSSH
jgi:predicted ATP-grasp superfamily ATP-dependent carboligase